MMEKTAIMGDSSSRTATMSAISTAKLTKQYGSSRGISELDLTVNEGEIFGFLGPNGAGKSTTIRLLLDLIKPTAGRASVLGLDSQRDSVAIRRQVGYLPGEFSLYPNLTGRQTLEYFIKLRGANSDQTWHFVQELAARLELDLTKKFKQYSRGNKQKIGIIQSLMHRPRLLILDEPTSGLDPLNQQEFLKMVKEARDAGSTVFFSSHVLSEVEKTCDRVAIIREGQLVKVGQISELTDLKNHHLELTFRQPVKVSEFESLPGVEKAEAETTETGQVLRLLVRADGLEGVVQAAARHPLANFISREPSLEETFLNYYKD